MIDERVIDLYLTEITRLHEMAEALAEDNAGSLMEKIEHLSKVLMYAGRVSSHFDEAYKTIYADRKRTWAEARVMAAKDKDAASELAIVELRQREAEAYGEMNRWRNARESIVEQIHAMKLKMRLNFQGEN